MYVVEGLDNVDWLFNGSFVIFICMYYVAVDGIVVVQMIWVLYDLDVRGKKLGVGGEYVISYICIFSYVEMVIWVWWNNVSLSM